MSTTHQKPTAPAQPSHSIAQKMLNTTPTYLPALTPTNLYLGLVVSIVVVITYWIWVYTMQPQPIKQTKRPTPIDTARTAIIYIAKITPPEQMDKIKPDALGRFAPSSSSVTDMTVENAYQMIVQGERGIVASEYKAKPSDPHCDVRQNLTAIQLALLATLEDDHQDKVIEELREDSDGVEGGFWIDDDAFKAMIQRCSRMI